MWKQSYFVIPETLRLLTWECKVLWTAKVRDWQKPFPHSSHLNGFSLLWMYLWSLRWSWRRNALPQMSQEYGLSSVWVLSCINRLYDFVKCRWQYLHMNSFFVLINQKKRSMNLTAAWKLLKLMMDAVAYLGVRPFIFLGIFVLFLGKEPGKLNKI